MHRGATIVELLVAIAVVTIVAGAGMGVSIAAGRRKTAENTAAAIKAQLFQARAYALEGKILQCTTADKLISWDVSFTASSMTLSEHCKPSGLHSTKTTVLPSSVTINPLPSVNPIAFTLLTGAPFLAAASQVTVTVTSPASANIVLTVSDQGLIQ